MRQGRAKGSVSNKCYERDLLSGSTLRDVDVFGWESRMDYGGWNLVPDLDGRGASDHSEQQDASHRDDSSEGYVYELPGCQLSFSS